MSMDNCHHCGDPVDTDRDTDCYIEMNDAVARASRETLCVCGACRSEAEEAYQEAEAERTR